MYSSELTLLKSGEVKPRGWILEQLRGDLQEGYVGGYDRVTPTARVGLFGANKADYEAPKPPRANKTWWSGEIEALWMDALIRMAFLTDDAGYQAVAARWVEDILRNIDADGYIGMYKPEIRFRHERENGELWTMSRAMMALLAYHEYTGDEKCRAAVEKAVGLVMSKYGENHSYFAPGEAGGLTHGLSFVDVLEWLYRLSEDDRYVRFAAFLYEDYGRHAQCNRDLVVDNLLKNESKFSGHGVHTAEQFAIPFFLADAAGGNRYREAAAKALEKFRFHQTPGGSINSDEDVSGKPGSADCLCEYCTFKSFTLTLTRVAMITGCSEVADWIERMVLNAAQGARFHPELSAVEYCSSDNRVSIDEKSHGGRLSYSACHRAAPCCTVSAAQTMPYYVEGLWMRRDKPSGLVAMQYGPCVLDTTVDGIPVRIEEETAYPFSDDLVFRVDPAKDAAFAVSLRKPGHVESIDISGIPESEIRREDDFVTVRRTWSKGDVLRMRFTCPVRKIAQPRSKTVDREDGGFYIRRGPLVYSLAFAHKVKTIGKLGDSGFKHYGVDTVDETGWDYAIEPEAEFKLERNGQGDALHPWHEPPLRLKGRLVARAGTSVPVTLVPLGCTILRRVTFPLFKPSR